MIIIFYEKRENRVFNEIFTGCHSSFVSREDFKERPCNCAIEYNLMYFITISKYHI